LSVLVLLGLTALFGGYSAICNGTSTPYQLWWSSWPSWTCSPFDAAPYNGVQPSWIGPNFQTYPTHFPTFDALYHGEWFLAWETVRRMIFPALTIAFTSIAGILRFVRNSMLEVMNLEYVRTARATGVSERTVVRHHAGRNSLIVTITVLGLTFAFFIGGFPITELIFNLKGVGLVLAYSILSPPDFGLIFGTTLLFTLIVVAANIIVDVLYAYLDPRVRLG
ncbi:MAG: ABC transporter permease, partial [Thermoplasmata archaeon]|nr:ABC transporter permease [Thermoplasmata archaeon]